MEMRRRGWKLELVREEGRGEEKHASREGKFGRKERERGKDFEVGEMYGEI